MAALGIDLGTSNSVVAVYRRGRVETLPVEGKTLVPSCVSVRPGGGGLLVGAQAKTRSLVAPAQTVLAIKRHMGERDYRVTLDGTDYSPVDIASMILKKIVLAAQERLQEPVRDVVISVPAYFTNNQKEDTRRAGELAGLNVLSLVPEPTAAAVAYGLDQGREQTILVYDLGGGTFDVSILRVRGNDFAVQAIGGCDKLGGEDFDRAMLDVLMAKLRAGERLPAQLDQAEMLMLYTKLKESAEAAKKELSSADTVEVHIPAMGPVAATTVLVKRGEYNDAIRPLVDQTIKITLDTIKQARLEPGDVDRVVLVGGSTRLPLVQQTLAERICEPYIADNVDEIVAHGAAILAAMRSSVTTGFAPVEVTNITAHSLGIRAADDKFSVLIERGTKLPTTAQKTFTTAVDRADRTDIVIFQGENERCSKNQQIGGFGLTGIARAKAGAPKIDVTFTLDADDILQVTAVERTTAQGGTITIERFTPKPFEPTVAPPAKSLHSLRYATSKVGCDNAGRVLESMQLRHDPLEHRDFNSLATLKQYDLVFINCLADLTQVATAGLFLNPNKNKEALREFVNQGGVLYVSDYALDNITHAFPKMVEFGRKGDGRSGHATATVNDPELRELVGATVPINFNTIYAPVASVSSACRVHLSKGSEPLLVSFAHGNGHVIYTSFHNGVQMSAKEGTLLSCIILQTIALATKSPLVELAEACHINAKR